MTPSKPAASSSPVKRIAYLIPLALLVVLAGYFWAGLGRDPQIVPSVLIDQPVPDIDLKPIKGREHGLSTADLTGEVSLVNIFGSWCVACRVEHPFLMRLNADDTLPINGINWREKHPDDGPAWLAKWGDPYDRVGDDPDSRAAIAFGVTGAPETFIVDAAGVIRYKHVGPITPEIWDETLWPIIQTLRAP